MNLFKMLKSLFTSAPRLDPQECAARVRAGDAFLIDVREAGEWSRGVAQGATLLPLSDLTGGRAQWGDFLTKAAGKEILVYCASGGRSGMAARILTAEGIRAANTGGLSDWAASGWPVVAPSGRRR
jgi:rhodanese-related sulfurtransferase